MKDESTHPEFLASLKTSRTCVWFIAQWLQDKYNLHVTVNAYGCAPTRAEALDYQDHGDLEISQRVEVKQLSRDFTGRLDWPFKNVIVCAKHSWDKATPKPFAFFYVSASRSSVAMVRGDTHPDWWVDEMPDCRRPDEPPQQAYYTTVEKTLFFRIDPVIGQGKG